MDSQQSAAAQLMVSFKSFAEQLFQRIISQMAIKSCRKCIFKKTEKESFEPDSILSLVAFIKREKNLWIYIAMNVLECGYARTILNWER